MRASFIRTILISALCLCALPALDARQVLIVAEGELAAPARHGLARLEQSFRDKGFDVVNSRSAKAANADFVVLAGVSSGSTVVTKTLSEWKAARPEGAEALTIQRGNYQNRPAVILCGADATGLMYAALDTADRVSWSDADGNPFQYVRDISEKPYLAESGRLHVHHAAGLFRKPPVRRAILGALFRPARGQPDQQLRCNFRLREWRLHGPALPLLL